MCHCNCSTNSTKTNQWKLDHYPVDDHRDHLMELFGMESPTNDAIREEAKIAETAGYNPVPVMVRGRAKQLFSEVSEVVMDFETTLQVDTSLYPAESTFIVEEKVRKALGNRKGDVDSVHLIAGFGRPMIPAVRVQNFLIKDYVVFVMASPSKESDTFTSA